MSLSELAQREAFAQEVELVRAGREIERRRLVRWLEARAEEHSPQVRATVLRLARRIEAGEGAE
jgi:hypothetical protein